jgi:hypothetical protein
VGAREPFSPTRLLWLNLISDTLPAMALALESAQDDVLRRPPAPPDAPLFEPAARRLAMRDGLGMAALGARHRRVASWPCSAVRPRCTRRRWCCRLCVRSCACRASGLHWSSQRSARAPCFRSPWAARDATWSSCGGPSMRFHFPSFLIGYGAGVATVVVGRQLRPVFVELASAAYWLADSVAARMAMVQEDFEDVLAEARARARGPSARRQRAAPRRRTASTGRARAR